MRSTATELQKTFKWDASLELIQIGGSKDGYLKYKITFWACIEPGAAYVFPNSNSRDQDGLYSSLEDAHKALSALPGEMKAYKKK